MGQSLDLAAGRLSLAHDGAPPLRTWAPADLEAIRVEKGVWKIIEPGGSEGFFANRGVERIADDMIPDAPALWTLLAEHGFPTR